MKKNLSNLPLSALGELTTTETIKDFLELEATSFKEHYVLPQVMAYLAKIPLVKNSEGLYDAKESLIQLPGSIPTFSDGSPCSLAQLKGILTLIKADPRGLAFPSGITQNAPSGLRYSAAVPLFISAFKEYNNIPYTRWDIPSIKCVTDRLNYEAISLTDCPSFTSEELLDFRDICRAKGPTAKNQTPHLITSITSPKKTGNLEFDSLPKLTRLQLMQVWVYLPYLRTEYGVYAPDFSIPKALVDTELLVATDKSQYRVRPDKPLILEPKPKPVSTSAWDGLWD